MSQAYQDGMKNGQTDRRLGIRSDHAYFSADSNNQYVREYAQGYRKGFHMGVR